MGTTGNLTKFHSLLQEQVRHEFTASQQYIALAVWFDGQDLPQLAKHFYRQSLEERNHAMMIVRYLLDNDIQPPVPGVDEVQNEFSKAADLVELALKQEKAVTDEIVKLARAARDEDDYKGEQFMQWFLKEQVEEVATMKRRRGPARPDHRRRRALGQPAGQPGSVSWRLTFVTLPSTNSNR